MAVLSSQQRTALEKAVLNARTLAETGAYNTLRSMAIDQAEPFAHQDAEQRALRNRLRNKGRLLGDELPSSGKQEINNLAYELAYEYWHKMLFAKFLEVNGLLMHPSGVAVTLEECEELAAEEGLSDKWVAASNYASKMLPAIFRVDDPLMQLDFAPNDRIVLETLIDGIEDAVFVADDSLGWVYQFWQTEAKATINASGDKIDGKRLPAVTQLFTEPYMVNFLIDNTLGAWWLSRNPGKTTPVKFEYLRVLPASSRNTSVVPTSSRDNITPDENQILFDFFSKYQEIENIKGTLPHWRQEGKLYFVTFRTDDSMPQEKLKQWIEERKIWLEKNPEPHTYEQKREYWSLFPAKLEQYIDAGYGACLLAQPALKTIVENALKHFEGDRYLLDEFVVAINHVHVLVQPLDENQLSDILHSWKSFTANEINKSTGKTGAFWQKESYDHLVRNEKALENIREYIRKHNTNKNNTQQENIRQDAGGTFGKPAAGMFEGWPDKTAEITSLDPCMGSGHFVASLFPVFATLRMHEEGLTKEEATDKVIIENLHGLEIDPRCTQIAAFNLALTAWKFIGKYKELPEMNLACSGIAPKGKKEDWVKLASKIQPEDKRARMENGMMMLYDHFQLAPELGSLLDPSTIKPDAFTASFNELQPVLMKALEGEADKDQMERGVMAAGIAKAGLILAKKYTLQITNVPYLTSGKQSDILVNYCMKNYSDAKGDLATVFLYKMLKSNINNGTSCSVIPQNWLFLKTYKKFREGLLNNEKWNIVARLGPKGFQTPMWDFNVMLIAISHSKISEEYNFHGLDVSEVPNALQKDSALKNTNLKIINQLVQLQNSDALISFEEVNLTDRLEKLADSIKGTDTGDDPRFVKLFWEVKNCSFPLWMKYQSTPDGFNIFNGKTRILLWENENGSFANESSGTIRRRDTLTKQAIAIRLTGKIQASLFSKSLFDTNAGAIIPKNNDNLCAIFTFCSSDCFHSEVRKLDQSLKATNAIISKVPFDLKFWQKVADEKYPNGLPKPYSDDPTQWLFHGHPFKSEQALHVAVARLLGYQWPAENDTEMELSEEARTLIKQVKELNLPVDEDGIVCIPPVNNEYAATERLRELLQKAWGSQWGNQIIEQLLSQAGSTKSNLEDWLRDEFFEQHCKVFQNRPFIWHIWDGRKDGFSALVNYHKLDKETLKKLIYTYLGDWIRQCEAKKNNNVSGADGLLIAAEKLKEKLLLIFEGEAPYDIFVRWKPLEKQSIGWNPDLNDGVRLNIRPFVEAGILRKRFNVKWGIDRGKNPPGSPWGEIRDNDKHLSLEYKRITK